jgi:5-methylcytosine-specific restriction endonuclease McrA
MHKVNGKSVRDYRRENIEYNSKPEQIKKRSERTTARRQANADGTMHKGDGLNLDHRVPLSKGGSNAKSNLRVVSEGANKSFSRNKDGSMKSQTSKRESKKK